MGVFFLIYLFQPTDPSLEIKLHYLNEQMGGSTSSFVIDVIHGDTTHKKS